ncbi:hypothetical protein GKZ68_20720 (plasmid) [Hymenobacter sp. BRD128]|uniref:hypothetical protein n=1 Tax=Hymenobacter sp. BRD128 TaxID=2675878 RepID=UPI001566D112|nr:hypothetical protein [Hymenobacter sp. BRD128]QKG59108.1 hypothetical protein GKZ68_20720 [Hymenobacter sp. BRD128]
MESIASLFANLPVSEALRARLADPTQLRNHRFYLELPHGLSVAFRGVEEASLQELVVSSYLYFRTLLFLDDLLDGETRAATEEEVEVIFLYFSLYERAVRGLATLFPGTHSFWDNLDKCKVEYARANKREKQLVGSWRAWTQEAYEELAAGKSAVCGALVYALEGLATDAGATVDILAALRDFHLAVQYEDDVLDFTKDLSQGQYTYVYDQLRLSLHEEGLAIGEFDNPLLGRLLFTTGTATRLLRRAAELYANVQQQAARLGIQMLGTYASRQLSENQRQQRQIAEEVSAAQLRASHPQLAA